MEEIEKIFHARSEFLQRLDEETSNADKTLENALTEIKKLQDVKDTIKTLSTYPEQQAMIPLAKYIYLPGVIEHTSAYHITHKAEPNSYTTLLTLDQTQESLERRVEKQQDTVHKCEVWKNQLVEKRKIITGESTEDNLPQEIRSDKGVAMKVGDYYEILEFEES